MFKYLAALILMFHFAHALETDKLIDDKSSGKSTVTTKAEVKSDVVKLDMNPLELTIAEQYKKKFMERLMNSESSKEEKFNRVMAVINKNLAGLLDGAIVLTPGVGLLLQTLGYEKAGSYTQALIIFFGATKLYLEKRAKERDPMAEMEEEFKKRTIQGLIEDMHASKSEN